MPKNIAGFLICALARMPCFRALPDGLLQEDRVTTASKRIAKLATLDICDDIFMAVNIFSLPNVV